LAYKFVLGTVFQCYSVTDWNAHHTLCDDYNRLECSQLLVYLRRQSACEL